jgi:beta-phosphoglucomutase-like phosphatase (HAD superfamily)
MARSANVEKAAALEIASPEEPLRPPEAILFDLDGVLADVSRSYRECVIATAAGYGVPVTPDEVARMKAAGNANNDWELTWRILGGKGVETTLEEVTARFEELYQGTEEEPGLRRTETLLCEVGWLKRLHGSTQSDSAALIREDRDTR